MGTSVLLKSVSNEEKKKRWKCWYIFEATFYYFFFPSQFEVWFVLMIETSQLASVLLWFDSGKSCSVSFLNILRVCFTSLVWGHIFLWQVSFEISLWISRQTFETDGKRKVEFGALVTIDETYPFTFLWSWATNKISSIVQNIQHFRKNAIDEKKLTYFKTSPETVFTDRKRG